MTTQAPGETAVREDVDVLVIDDEQGMRDFLSYELGSLGWRISSAQNGEEALARLRGQFFHLVITDIRMPKMGGLTVLEAIKRASPDTEVIMMTGFGTIETAVATMKQGAFDFIQKPFQASEITALARKALEKKELRAMLAIQEASKAVFASIKLEDILPVITSLAMRLLKADDVSLMLLKDGHLELVASYGLKSQAHKGARLALGERVAGKVAQQKQALSLVGPLNRDPRFAGVAVLREIKASIVQPLVVNGEVLGVLNTNRTLNAEPFMAADMRHMEIFASHVAQSVFNARMHKQLHQTQEQLIHSEKINAIGRFASGIAHELNNPLTGVLGCVQLILEGGRLTGTDKEDAEVILEQTQRCRHLIEDLLQFSRKRKPKKEAVSLYPLLESSLRLARFDLSADVAVLKDWPQPGPALLADPMQLKQIFVNLIRNAGHAMETSSRKCLLVQVEAEGPKVRIHFQDSGCGIPKANLAQLFQPFFTTKVRGKGTGLGLSICASIIKQHGGTIRVESREKAGATFTVELPKHEAGHQ